MSPIFLTRVWITQTTHSWKSRLSLHLVEYIQSRFLREGALPSVVTLAVKNTSSCACCPFSNSSKNSVRDQEKQSKATSKKARQPAQRQGNSYTQIWSSRLHRGVKGCALWGDEAKGPALSHLQTSQATSPTSARSASPGVHSVAARGSCDRASTEVLRTEKRTAIRKVILALDRQYAWDLSLHTIPNIQCSDCKTTGNLITDWV